MHSEVTIYPHAMDLSLCRAYYKLPSATVTPSLESILDSLQPAKKWLLQMYQLVLISQTVPFSNLNEESTPGFFVVDIDHVQTNLSASARYFLRASESPVAAILATCTPQLSKSEIQLALSICMRRSNLMLL